MRERTVSTAASALVFLFAVAERAPAELLSVQSSDDDAGSCTTPSERSATDRTIAEHQAHLPRSARAPATEPVPYPFYPLAGNAYADLFANNFVDLDPTAGNILDWNCGGFTYDGHQGYDTDIRSFGEQAIGVPIFAALDGTVVATRDGEPDMNTSCPLFAVANQVQLHHGASHYSLYLHMRNGSVAVAPGDAVTAGTQLGLTGSSGCSTQPHLHFESRFGGNDNASVYEPSAGPCRAGPSYWVQQTPIDTTLYMSDFTLTGQDLTVWPGYPTDTTRTGTFVVGPQTTYFWTMLRNLSGNNSARVRYVRPDTTIALDQTTPLTGPGFYRWLAPAYAYNVNLDQLGTWHILYDIDGQNLVDAPFDVVASVGAIVNRAPAAVAVALDPAAPSERDVIFCRVATSLTLDDPDYDIVRYHYQWTVNSQIVRDVAHAGQADALPWDAVRAGDAVECTVTPEDASAAGPVAVASVTIASVCAVAPLPGCHGAPSSQVGLTSKPGGAKKLKWKWSKGDATTADELDDPTYATPYSLCMYDSVAGVPALVASVALPMHAGWAPKGDGYKFKDKSGHFSGATGISIKPGTAGKPKIVFKGAGDPLPLPAPVGTTFFVKDPSVTIQLVNGNGSCWTSEFTSATVSTSEQFKARAP